LASWARDRPRPIGWLGQGWANSLIGIAPWPPKTVQRPLKKGVPHICGTGAQNHNPGAAILYMNASLPNIALALAVLACHITSEGVNACATHRMRAHITNLLAPTLLSIPVPAYGYLNAPIPPPYPASVQTRLRMHTAFFRPHTSSSQGVSCAYPVG